MLTYLSFFKTRYLNQKGQGMVEYAVILAVVIAIGVALIGDQGTLATQVKNLYTAVFAKTSSLTGTTTP